MPDGGGLVYEWRARVRCPVRPVEDDQPTSRQGTGFIERDVHVWTQDRSAVDAYDEALRVLEHWPRGTRPVDVVLVGRYVPTVVTA